MNEDAEKEEKKSVSFSFSARRPRNRKRGRKTPQSGRSRKQTGTSFRATKPGNNSVKPSNPPPNSAPLRLCPRGNDAFHESKRRPLQTGRVSKKKDPMGLKISVKKTTKNVETKWPSRREADRNCGTTR